MIPEPIIPTRLTTISRCYRRVAFPGELAGGGECHIIRPWMSHPPVRMDGVAMARAPDQSSLDEETSPLDAFHPAIAEWFRRRFVSGPTEAQARGWASIAS